ncbi:MAG: hypothetical protein RIS29_1992 [Bacteroidota bacterium]|jgi:tetratricopeptide (TPR) repeat protein
MLVFQKRIGFFQYIILLLVLTLAAVSCSTKKNTWSSRTYQALNTSYNVYFNGYVSYNDGLKNILKANKEDYSNVIPMYPISHHANATAATSDMDRTIEKCRKAIKLHSIKVKPEKDYKKMSDPKYKAFLAQEEFNPAMKEAWLLLAKAEFHKADFLGSVGTFSYIKRHYSYNSDLVTTCQLWIARAYAEMDWMYEAEQVISKLDQNNLKGANTGLFAAVSADMMIKKKLYKEAIPFLELALKDESDKAMKQRFNFVLAQLYQRTGDVKLAFDSYSRVISMNPSYEMDFNARINRAQLDVANVSKIRHELRKMLGNRNNKEYKDQIYYALGNTYLLHGDTATAILNYKLSADTSSRKGIDKAVTLITLGDLYYQKRKYVAAQPCYDEASKILSVENDNYIRVKKRAETLSELVTQNDIVVLQDSLQGLSKMSEIDRMKVIKAVIDKLIAEEKAAEQKALKENERRNRGPEEDDFATMPPIGAASVGGWYFYNPDILRNGQTEFIKKWGKRKLEDNWRRANKSASLFGDDLQAQRAENDTLSADTLKRQPGAKAQLVSDNKKPEFYLQQIPVTASQLAKSDGEIADALFAMGEIYKDKVEDYSMAISTFNEFIRRFGTDKRVPDAYYNLYIIQVKTDKKAEAELLRLKLIQDYPNSKYSKVLSDANYAETLKKMYAEQDSIYEKAYLAYNKSDFETVFQSTEYIRKAYPLSSLMPKFMLLNALSIGKKDSPEKFRKALEELIATYPGSDVSAMAKDMLALVKQGKESKVGTAGGSLLAKRDEKAVVEQLEISKMKFSAEKKGRHRLMLIASTSLESMQKLQYEMAKYNFSHFLIKDFDLAINKLDTSRNVLSVLNFDSYDEVEWYQSSLKAEASVEQALSDLNIQKVIISEENFGLLKASYRLEDYLAFMASPQSQKQIAEQPKLVKQTVASIPPQEAAQLPEITNKKLSEKKPEAQPMVVTTPKKVEKAETVKPSAKPISQPVATDAAKTETKPQPTAVEAKKAPETSSPAVTQTPAVVPPKQEEVPLYKGLFAYKANDPHFVVMYVISGTMEYEKVRTAFEAYNKLNYPKEKLTLQLEKADKLQLIIIGSFADAATSKAYLLKMVKEKGLFDGMKNANYRNLLGTQKNINVVVQQNALNTYFDFMKEYYLK